MIQKIPKSGRRSTEQNESISAQMDHDDVAMEDNTAWKNATGSAEELSSLPQWNGVRIQHPMDPRIDLTTVGHIQTSALSAFPSNVNIPTSKPSEQPRGSDNSCEGSEAALAPSIDQYMKLMEVNFGEMGGIKRNSSDLTFSPRSSARFFTHMASHRDLPRQGPTNRAMSGLLLTLRRNLRTATRKGR